MCSILVYSETCVHLQVHMTDRKIYIGVIKYLTYHGHGLFETYVINSGKLISFVEKNFARIYRCHDREISLLRFSSF